MRAISIVRKWQGSRTFWPRLIINIPTVENTNILQQEFLVTMLQYNILHFHQRDSIYTLPALSNTLNTVSTQTVSTCRHEAGVGRAMQNLFACEFEVRDYTFPSTNYKHDIKGSLSNRISPGRDWWEKIAKVITTFTQGKSASSRGLSLFISF